jgi:hypothetical protein
LSRQSASPPSVYLEFEPASPQAATNPFQAADERGSTPITRVLFIRVGRRFGGQPLPHSASLSEVASRTQMNGSLRALCATMPASRLVHVMVSVNGKTSVTRARLLLYAFAIPGAIALDSQTPLGVADWLIGVILVWVASEWGSVREMMLIASAGSAEILIGLWSSPASQVSLWLGALNRFGAIAMIWAMVDVARRRRISEEAERKATAEIRILQGLIPICASCKAMRTTAGDWQKLESYLSDHSEVRLTHSLCPSCADRFLEDLESLNPR